MSVRAKVYLSSIREYETAFEYSFSAVGPYVHGRKETDPENKKFWDATPSLALTVTVNKDKQPAPLFVLGQEYYLDWTVAPIPGAPGA